MADCENLLGCPFFNDAIPHMPLTAQYLKSTYCTDKPHMCARYMVCKALGKDQVPLDLFPEEITKAEIIIRLRK
jgi:hypothetical protein